MHAQEAVIFSNIAATTASFELKGGRYQFAASATFNGGSVGLQQLGPDGATFLSVVTPITVKGGQVLDLPPGQYQVVIVTATAVFASIVRIPGE